MKLVSKIFLIILFLIVFFVSYLSTVGVETDRFNYQISNRIKNIDEKLELDLKTIKLLLDPFTLKVNIKTVGAKLSNQNKEIEIENIKTKISLKSLLVDKFGIENLEISTKSLELKNLISFIRSFKNTPELFILEKTIRKGYLIADLKLEFDDQGKLKKNFSIDGYIRDTKLSFLKKYNIQKLNFIFQYNKNNLSINEIAFLFNDLKFLSKEIKLKKVKDDIFIEGNINHKNLNIDEKNLDLFVRPIFKEYKVNSFEFSSNNSFSFIIDNKYQIRNIDIVSDMIIKKLTFFNNLNLKSFFPDLRENITFLNNKLSIKYKNENLDIIGKGDILFQNENDSLDYFINKKANNLDFKTSLRINNNSLLIDPLNYKKDKKKDTIIELQGSQNSINETLIKSFSLNEFKNTIKIKNLILNKKFEITGLDSVNLNYLDKDNQKNVLNFNKKKNFYELKGSFFNANKLINNLLLDEKETPKILNINDDIVIKIDKILLDNEYYLSKFYGKITFKDKEIVKANLIGNFPNDKKLQFTINTKQDNKITTLFIDKAEPILKRYKFIKGFDGGSLDYFSVKKFDESVSQLKIYDFKLKELPVLTKILTLASLQGIADILSGEGITFQELEMNFKNKGNSMTIDEIYAIGPSISILMEGYVEKKKLISLRGTLVPATTINKFIGSLPVLGKVLVGSKTGEGVFGVSFKIKGPPKKLETTVNPIKTLTPRFITRTIEKIKTN